MDIAIRRSAPDRDFTGDKHRPRRVFIADEYPIVREGLRQFLENEVDLTFCGEAQSAREACLAIKQVHPDILICDITLKDDDGIKLVREARAHHPELPILILSSNDESIYAERMLALGANGYISKQATREQFLASLRHVLDGNTYVSDIVGNRIIEKYAAGRAPVSKNPIERLSDRELQVLLMIGRGMSTRETAVTLHLSAKTVESHRQRIKQKLNLHTSTQLMRYAVLSHSDPMRSLAG